MQRRMSLDEIRITTEDDAAQERRLWASVKEVAEAVVSADDPPAGFVRRELPIGESQVDVWAGVAGGEQGATTVVVVVPSQDGPLPDAGELRRRFGLTPRESEVALLLAARRSNKEIARHLSIANKTAWRHTSSVLSKLGTSSRRDVGRLLRRSGERGRRARARRIVQPAVA